jgi:GAF domain-containing protein
MGAFANVVCDGHDNITTVMEACTDITAPTLYEVLLRQVLGAMLAEMSLHETVGLLCREIRRLAPELGVAVLSVDDENVVRVAGMAGLPVEYLQLVDGLKLAQAGTTWMAAADTVEPVAVADIQQRPAWQTQSQAVRGLGVKAVWSQAIKGAHASTIGVLALYFSVPRFARILSFAVD